MFNNQLLSEINNKLRLNFHIISELIILIFLRHHIRVIFTSLKNLSKFNFRKLYITSEQYIWKQKTNNRKRNG